MWFCWPWTWGNGTQKQWFFSHWNPASTVQINPSRANHWPFPGAQSNQFAFEFAFQSNITDTKKGFHYFPHNFWAFISWPFNPSLLAFWAFMCFHFGLLGLLFFSFLYFGLSFPFMLFFSFPLILVFWAFMCFYHGVVAIPLAIPLDTLLDTHECQKCTPSLDAHARLSLHGNVLAFSCIF